VVGKPVNPKCGLRVECVGNRHDDKQQISYEVVRYSYTNLVICYCYFSPVVVAGGAARIGWLLCGRKPGNPNCGNKWAR